MRVVSLACSNTEIVAALGCEKMLVAVDEHSDSPAEVVNNLPKVGPDLSIDMDKVAAYKPDLVLASLTVPGHEKNIEGLKKAGLKYIAPAPSSLKEVYDSVLEIAEKLEVLEKGKALVKEMRQEIVWAESKKTPEILVQWWNNPVISPGGLSWVTDLIELAGGLNPLGYEEHKSRPLSDEEVIKIDPDIIVMAWCGGSEQKLSTEVIYNNKKWQKLKAVKNKQVYIIPEAYLGRPGPNLVKGYKAIRRIIEEFDAK